MSVKRLVPLNLPVLDFLPAGNRRTGDMLFYSVDQLVYVFDGTDWVVAVGGGGGSGGGDITSVTAGTGLTGGGLTGSVTLSIDTETVATLSDSQTLSNKTLTSVRQIDFDPAVITADVKTISVTSPFLIDSFSATGYRSAEYLLQLTQGSAYTLTKVLVIHDGTDVSVSEYGYVSVGSAIDYAVTGAFSLGNLELSITCSTANVTSVGLKFSRTLFDA